MPASVIRHEVPSELEPLYREYTYFCPPVHELWNETAIAVESVIPTLWSPE